MIRCKSSISLRLESLLLVGSIYSRMAKEAPCLSTGQSPFGGSERRHGEREDENRGMGRAGLPELRRRPL